MTANCLSSTTQRLVSLIFAVALTVATFPGLFYNAGQ